jgi:hypothetical protein
MSYNEQIGSLGLHNGDNDKDTLYTAQMIPHVLNMKEGNSEGETFFSSFFCWCDLLRIPEFYQAAISDSACHDEPR